MAIIRRIHIICTFFYAYAICMAAHADVYDEIVECTGSHSRVVWARCVSGESEADVESARYSLMGLDTRARTTAPIIQGPVSCANPWITPDGSSVVYTDWPSNEVHIIGWNGTGGRKLTDGFGLCVWANPVTGSQWVYVSDKAYGSRIERCRIDSTAVRELVWDNTQVSIRFRVSADGTRGGGEFPWNKAGVVTLPNGTFTQYGSGCNSMIAPDNSYRFFHMVATHREIYMYDNGDKNCRVIRLDTAPGVGGQQVWIPKWSNRARFLTMAGPGGLDSVHHNIYLGAFDSTFSSIERWVKVTDIPDTVDMYAYAWIGTARQLMFNPPGLEFFIDSAGGGERVKTVAVTRQDTLDEPLSAHDDADWLTVSAERTGTTSGIRNTVSPDGLDAGIYLGEVTVRSETVPVSRYAVKLRIDGPRRLQSMTVFPSDVNLFGHCETQFSANGIDQFGEPVETAVRWSVSGGGVIDGTGKFEASGQRGEYTVTARSSGDSTVSAVSRVSVYDDIIVLSPKNGDVFETGSALCVRWEADTDYINGIAVYLSLDSGVSWALLSNQAVTVSDTMWGNFCVQVPESVNVGDTMVAALSAKCRIRICNYPDEPPRAVSEGTFMIREKVGVAHHPVPPHLHGAPVIRFDGRGRLELMIGASGPFSVRLFDLSGRSVFSVSGRGPAYLRPVNASLARGVYIVHSQVEQAVHCRLLRIAR